MTLTGKQNVMKNNSLIIGYKYIILHLKLLLCSVWYNLQSLQSLSSEKIFGNFFKQINVLYREKYKRWGVNVPFVPLKYAPHLFSRCSSEFSDSLFCHFVCADLILAVFNKSWDIIKWLRIFLGYSRNILFDCILYIHKDLWNIHSVLCYSSSYYTCQTPMGYLNYFVS